LFICVSKIKHVFFTSIILGFFIAKGESTTAIF